MNLLSTILHFYIFNDSFLYSPLTRPSNCRIENFDLQIDFILGVYGEFLHTWLPNFCLLVNRHSYIIGQK